MRCAHCRKTSCSTPARGLTPVLCEFESMYDLLQNIIRITPLLILVGLFVGLNGKKWYWRSFFVVVVGWLVFAISTNVYWWYAFQYAPNDEVRSSVALKDGAPRVFVALFGWAFALVFLIVAELIRNLTIFCFRFLKINGRKFT